MTDEVEELRREVETLRRTRERLIALLRIQAALRSVDEMRLMTDTCVRCCPFRRYRRQA